MSSSLSKGPSQRGWKLVLVAQTTQMMVVLTDDQFLLDKSSWQPWTDVKLGQGGRDEELAAAYNEILEKLSAETFEKASKLKWL